MNINANAKATKYFWRIAFTAICVATVQGLGCPKWKFKLQKAPFGQPRMMDQDGRDHGIIGSWSLSECLQQKPAQGGRLAICCSIFSEKPQNLQSKVSGAPLSLSLFLRLLDFSPIFKKQYLLIQSVKEAVLQNLHSWRVPHWQGHVYRRFRSFKIIADLQKAKLKEFVVVLP